MNFHFKENSSRNIYKIMDKSRIQLQAYKHNAPIQMYRITKQKTEGPI